MLGNQTKALHMYTISLFLVNGSIIHVPYLAILIV